MTDEGARWVRVSRGLYLLGVGTFLLLTTQAVLPWSFWSEALAYWPVLLVAIGVRLVFERSPAAWVVLLGPFLVLGTMMYVALRAPGPSETVGEWVPLRAERTADLPAWTLEGRLGLASLDVRSRRLQRGVLLEGRATEIGRGSVRVSEGAGPGVVRVTNSWNDRTLFVLPGVRRARCELGVTAAVPVTLDLDLALTTTRLDVASGPLSRFALAGALNDLSLRLGRPSSDVRLDVEGAFNQVLIEVPAATPVRVSREGFLNVVDEKQAARVVDAGREHGPRGGDGGPDDAPGYRLNLQGAFNRIVVRSW